MPASEAKTYHDYLPEIQEARRGDTRLKAEGTNLWLLRHITLRSGTLEQLGDDMAVAGAVIHFCREDRTIEHFTGLASGRVATSLLRLKESGQVQKVGDSDSYGKTIFSPLYTDYQGKTQDLAKDGEYLFKWYGIKNLEPSQADSLGENAKTPLVLASILAGIRSRWPRSVVRTMLITAIIKLLDTSGYKQSATHFELAAKTLGTSAEEVRESIKEWKALAARESKEKIDDQPAGE